MKHKTDTLLEKSVCAFVSHDEFHHALLNFVRRHDREDILRSFAGTPSADEVARERAIRTYVKQLEIIDADDEDVLEAVNHYIQATVDRTVWAEKGYIDRSMLDAFEKDLRSTWRNKRTQVETRDAALGPKKRGLLLLASCREHSARLNGLECPPHFTPGSFHELAEVLSIGWHPDYKAALGQAPGEK